LGLGAFDDGGAWVKCHAGCDSDDVLAKIGLTKSDMQPARPEKRNGSVKRTPKAFPTLESALHEAAASVARKYPGAVRGPHWLYHDMTGAVHGAILRINLPTPPDERQKKEFRPLYRIDAGFCIGDGPGLWPLYRLPKIAALESVNIFEGEGKTDVAASCGLATTATVHGAEAAAKTNYSPLAKVGEVVIWPDNDDPSEGWALDIAGHVRAVNPDCVIKIVRIAEHVENFPEHGDFADFAQEFRDGRTAEDIRAEVEGWIAAAEPLAVEAPPSALANRAAVEPMLTCMADVEPREVSWLWRGRIPLGRITLLVGRPGGGKSFLTTDIAARVTTGTPFPDGAPCPLGSVLLITAEDDPGDTIRPRLDAHHADVRKVHLLSGTRLTNADGESREVFFTLADVATLTAALERLPDCKLLIIDPIGSFLGGKVDAHRDNEVRGVLAPIAQLAEKHGVAVLVVAHRRKAAGDVADDLALGSRAFTGIARAVWHLARPKNEPVRRFLLPGKNNLAAEGNGLAFTIDGDPPRLFWEEGVVEMDADDGLAAEQAEAEEKPGPEPTARNAAAGWLRKLLEAGEVDAGEVEREAAAAGVGSWRTVQRAADELGVERVKPRFGSGWVWRLPAPAEDVTAPKDKQLGILSSSAKTGVCDGSAPEDAKLFSLGMPGGKPPRNQPQDPSMRASANGQDWGEA